MSVLKNLSIASMGTAVISFGAIAPVSAASFYDITGLNFLPSGINDKGEVVGDKYLWQAGKVTDLSTPPGSNGSNLSARAINNNSVIVGGGFKGDIPDTRGFISDGTTIQDLGRPGNFCIDYCPPTTAVDINDANVVALNYYSGGDRNVTYIQDESGTKTTVLNDNLAIGINNSNQVIGYSPTRARGAGTGGLWTEGETTYLTPDTKLQFGIYRTATADINNLGQVVGLGNTGENDRAQIWSDPLSNSVGAFLGTLGGGSRANGINDSTQVVGESNLGNSYDSTQHAFLWENGALTDLNNLIDPASGWELTSALKINNNGDIIGIGNLNGEQRGFIASTKPVPEPSSILGVLGLGMFGLVGWRKRQTKR